MILETLTVSPYETNCYIFGTGPGGSAFVIDPGDNGSGILRRVEDLRLSVSCIILTHGHVDHIGALKEVKETTGAPVAINLADASMLQDNTLAALLGMQIHKLPKPDILLQDGQKIESDTLTLKTIYTPGHTQGSICLLGKGLIFTGDTLFRDGIGRTDLPGGSYPEIMRSIKTLLFTLPDETKVYPGHGPLTTIGDEKLNNPFFG